MAEIEITQVNFEKEVLKSNLPVLVDFWASWCGPCRMLSPIVTEIAAKYDGKIKVGKVNVDEEPMIADAFKVSSIPMLVLIENGIVKKTSIGYRPIEEIEAMLQ